MTNTNFIRNVAEDETIDIAINLVITAEGGYVDHPNDKGGSTNFGITQTTWTDYLAKFDGVKLPPNYPPFVEEITRNMAKEFYVYMFAGSGITRVDDNTVYLPLFDYYVNAGRNAIKTVQTLLGKEYSILVDGYLGPKTADMLNQYIETSGSREFVYSLTSRRIDHYIKIVLGDHSQSVFLRGWINRSVKCLEDYDKLTKLNLGINKLFAS